MRSVRRSIKRLSTSALTAPTPPSAAASDSFCVGQHLRAVWRRTRAALAQSSSYVSVGALLSSRTMICSERVRTCRSRLCVPCSTYEITCSPRGTFTVAVAGSSSMSAAVSHAGSQGPRVSAGGRRAARPAVGRGGGPRTLVPVGGVQNLDACAEKVECEVDAAFSLLDHENLRGIPAGRWEGALVASGGTSRVSTPSPVAAAAPAVPC